MPSAVIGWFERNAAAMRRTRLVLIAVVLAASAVIGVKRGRDISKFDFRCFYLDAAALAGGADIAETTWLEWYLPGFRVVLTPLGRLSPLHAAMAWNAMNLAAAIVSLVVLSRAVRVLHSGERDRGRAEFVALVAFVLIQPLIVFNFQCNQLSMWPLAMLSLAMLAALRRRESFVGFWLGLAIFIKVIPALLVGWCLLRRRFAAAIIAVAVPAALSLGIDAAVNGPAAAWRHHAHWYHICVTGSAGAAFLQRGAYLTHQNQGLAAVLGRVLQPGPPDRAGPLGPEFDRPLRPVNVTTLESATITLIYRAIVAASALALAFITWRGRRDAASEFGLLAIWCVAIVWFAPLARQYYEVWALPALHFLADRWWQRRRAGMSAAVCVAALTLWLVGLLGWALPEFRAVGGNQWVNLAVMAAVAVELFAAAPAPRADVTMPR
jgi:hypothetical protein